MSSQKILLIATTNPGKVAELRTLLASCLDLSRIVLATADTLGVSISPVEETGMTFADNARLKALAFSAATGLPALADDSGLCVDALEGGPGLHSARWAGPAATDAERNALLLEKMVALPDAPRSARFQCAAAVATPSGVTSVAEGVCEGRVTERPSGTQGFGYDSIFFIPALGRTLAELSEAEKNEISHRALAIRGLAPSLVSVGFPAAFSP